MKPFGALLILAIGLLLAFFGSYDVDDVAPGLAWVAGVLGGYFLAQAVSYRGRR